MAQLASVCGVYIGTLVHCTPSNYQHTHTLSLSLSLSDNTPPTLCSPNNKTYFDYKIYYSSGTNTVHRIISTLPGTWAGPGHPANCGKFSYCIGPYSFGWAIKGFNDKREGMPASLKLDPFLSEPDTRR